MKIRKCITAFLCIIVIFSCFNYIVFADDSNLDTIEEFIIEEEFAEDYSFDIKENNVSFENNQEIDDERDSVSFFDESEERSTDDYIVDDENTYDTFDENVSYISNTYADEIVIEEIQSPDQTVNDNDFDHNENQYIYEHEHSYPIIDTDASETAAYDGSGGVYTKLISLKQKFPDGKYWNHYIQTWDDVTGMVLGSHYERYSDYISDSPCAVHGGNLIFPSYDCNNFDGGIQCCGFAKKIFYELFAERESSNTLIRQPGYSGMQVGDYVHFYGFEHYAIVLSISGSTFTVVECNAGSPCRIRWGGQYNLSQVDYYVHSHNYDSVNGQVPSVSVSFENWSNDKYTYIRETDASIGQHVYISGGNCTATGMYLYDANGNHVATAHQDTYYKEIYFKINEECGYTLSPGKTYKYKFYAVVNGQTYWGSEGSFSTPHTHIPVKEADKAATCTQNGFTGASKCSICGAIITERSTIPAKGHDWGEWTVENEATTTSEGIEIRICKNDSSHIEKRTIKVKTHTHSPVKENDKAATCTQSGYTGATSCSECGETLTARVTIPATGHNWDAWTVVKEATATADGLERRVCKNDSSHTEEKAIKASGSSEQAILSVSSTSASSGSEFNVQLSLSKNPGIAYLDFSLSYDNNTISLVGFEDGKLTGWTVNTTSGKGVWARDKVSSATGDILTLKFIVLDGIKSGSYKIDITAASAYNLNDDVGVSVNGGSVTISDRLSGDVNGDNVLNGRDLVRLKQYLAGYDVTINSSNADVTGDGKVDGRDAVRLCRYFAGYEEKLA